ncbi:hypothetical protein F5Y10DRAFT_264099 [Nemania abortiva]|nr:hypothetical protein F5Y10DRAFT_264099 [Nemania abortiva]
MVPALKLQTPGNRTSSRGDPTPDSSPSQSREESPTGYNQGPRFTEDKDGDVEMEDAEKSERKNDATADSALKQQNSLPRQRYTLPDEYRKNWPHVWRNVGQQNKYDVEMNGTESDDEEDDDSYVSRDSDDEDSESETESESESESESDTSDDGSDEDEWSSDDSSDDDEDEDDY